MFLVAVKLYYCLWCYNLVLVAVKIVLGILCYNLVLVAVKLYKNKKNI